VDHPRVQVALHGEQCRRAAAAEPSPTLAYKGPRGHSSDNGSLDRQVVHADERSGFYTRIPC
jgi:hypothetical protein